MKLKKILKNPWFIGIIFFLLGLIFYKGNIQTSGNKSPGSVEGNFIAEDQVLGDKIKVEGDYVKGDKYEVNQNINQKSPSDFVQFSQQKRIHIESLLKSFSSKYNYQDIKILINTRKNDDNTMRFLSEIEKLFESYNINVSIVPMIIVGGSKSDWPIEINYTNETKNVIKDFILCFQGFIAQDKLIQLPPPLETNLPKKFNISIQLFYTPYFDSYGGIYFQDMKGTAP